MDLQSYSYNDVIKYVLKIFDIKITVLKLQFIGYEYIYIYLNYSTIFSSEHYTIRTFYIVSMWVWVKYNSNFKWAGEVLKHSKLSAR